MIILGIEEGHNSTAAIMKDGKIVAAVSRERLSRKKNDTGYSKQAVEKCLELAGISPDQIDKVAFSTLHTNMAWLRIKKMCTYSINDHVREQHEYFKPLLIDKKPVNEWEHIKGIEERKGVQEMDYDFSLMNENNFSDPNLSKKMRTVATTRHLNISPEKVEFIDHHECHSNYAYFSSPFRADTLILTADGFGDGLNATVSVARDNKITRIFQTDNCQIARIYRYITLLLGMKPFEHEYKVMGLAPYSNVKELERAYEVFSELMKVEGLEFQWNKKPSDLYFHFKEKLEGCRFDGIAGALQKMVEEIFVQWIRNAINRTGIRRVVFSGGVAMNIKLNMAISNMPEVEEFFVSASPADESNALGACYRMMSKHCEDNNIEKSTIQPLRDAYLGPDITEASILSALQETGAADRYEVLRNIDHRYIAERLVEGKVVGICRGRMEFGARALGNRSILANPANPHIIQKINSQIKFRDFWMPFTPSILHERVNDYVVNPKNLYSPFMTLGFDSTPLGRKEILASLHPADLTARPQMVKKEINPQYYDLIKEFEKLTGIGAVLNTSLNIHGSPVVCSAQDAIEVMDNSKLDMMYFGDLLLIRRETAGTGGMAWNK